MLAHSLVARARAQPEVGPLEGHAGAAQIGLGLGAVAGLEGFLPALADAGRALGVPEVLQVDEGVAPRRCSRKCWRVSRL